MRKPLIPILTILCALPLMAQKRPINPAEAKRVDDGNPESIRKFMHDISSLQDLLKAHHGISVEEEASTRDAMVKALLKQIKGPMKGTEMNIAMGDIRELGVRKILSSLQVATIRKQLLLARYVESPDQKDEE